MKIDKQIVSPPGIRTSNTRQVATGLRTIVP